MNKMSKKNMDTAKSMIIELDPTECPFREFRDNELSPETWGLGPAACRAAILFSSKVPKPSADFVWVDDQTQPLPRSVRQYLNGWIRAEDLASDRWDADVVIFEDNDGSKMSVSDIQLSHAQVLMRSSFCRRVLSSCFMLERVEGLVVEHQWENFVFSLNTEGWRARYHIYSPGLKPGGGSQHRPGLSKNGCYLVRLFYLGAWRCVWVNDQVPVDATDSPLLPFSPLLTRAPIKPGTKAVPTMITSDVVHLWPLLICKALLKLAAPDMSAEDPERFEDEEMPSFDILHALTGCMNLSYHVNDPEKLWKLLTSEIPVFTWDDDDETLASTVKSKSTKKPTAKEAVITRRSSMGTVLIQDTKGLPAYLLPGITPGHEMMLLVKMARDVPLKKPLPEPEVALWKYYRWVDWARAHGLYEAYDCPRTRFLKVNGLMKLSYAPHLLDVQSTESITHGFREEHDKGATAAQAKKQKQEVARGQAVATSTQALQNKEELREWVQFDPLSALVKCTNILYFPSMFEFTSAASCPPVRVTKSPINRAIDIIAPKCAPLYLQIDGPDENCLKLSLSMLHPRIQINSGIPLVDYIESAYLILEKFDWFVDCELPRAKAFVKTRGYDSVEVNFLPGRHFCRLWVHSRLNWHVMLLSESSLLLGTRDVIQTASVRECPWASRFLNNLSMAFSNWIRVNRSNPAIVTVDREFFRSYQPDLEWVAEVVGYKQALIHWMFRQALQSLLFKKIPALELRAVCVVLRHYFCDPDFGLPPKPKPPISLREMIARDPCDCLMPEIEEVEAVEEEGLEEETPVEERPLLNLATMTKLLTPPMEPIASQVCELAREELPCGILKDEREKMIKKYEAATVIQAHWRGTWARKCLNDRVLFTPEVMKLLMENSFGNLESLSALMNQFFGMYPGAKTAYSVASALSGVNGVAQHHGISSVSPRCKWIPYFQGVFFCHTPVKVHLDIQSSIPHSTVMAYNNDTAEPMPQAFNSHITYDFVPNEHGYTVMAHGTLSSTSVTNYDIHWQLTVLSSIVGAFHICDNDPEGCKEMPLQPAYKLHIDEMFLPNRRNILGGILIAVTKHEAISFRSAATSPELQMVATLRSISPSGETIELAKCRGKGEIYWPYIRLKPAPTPELTMKKRSTSQANLNLRAESAVISSRSLKTPPKQNIIKPTSAKGRLSNTKLKGPAIVEPKQYSIEVTTPTGWPLTLAQWRRVDEVRNTTAEVHKIEAPKKPVKEKPGSAKDKEKPAPPPVVVKYIPQPDDAYIELECSLTVGGGALARRDDLRDIQFLNARKQWDADQPGRNNRGAQIRKDFRAEFLETLPPPPSESSHEVEEMFGEFEGEEEKKLPIQQGPTPATESGMLEMTIESEEEALYLLMPEQLKDKFISLYFLPFCMKEKIEEEESVLLTPDIAEAAKINRLARIEAGMARMNELQAYNELYVLGRQRKRTRLLETLFVDSQLSPELEDVMQERDEALAQEALLRQLSATKKKQEAKKK